MRRAAALFCCLFLLPVCAAGEAAEALRFEAEDGSLTAECEVLEADGVLLLTTEDGNTYWFDIAGGALGDRALP